MSNESVEMTINVSARDTAKIKRTAELHGLSADELIKKLILGEVPASSDADLRSELGEDLFNRILEGAAQEFERMERIEGAQ